MNKSFTKVVAGTVTLAVALGVGGAIYMNRSAIAKSGGAHGFDEVPESHAVMLDQTPVASRPGVNELVLKASVVEKMNLIVAPAHSGAKAIQLPGFQGVLALDQDLLSRVHSRFDGEVVEIGLSTDGSDPILRIGDKVTKGDLLAVIWSTELGQKKSDYVDALTKLHEEAQLRDRLKSLYQEGASSGRSYRDAEKDVQTRMVEVANLERTLRTWRLTDGDIKAIQEESKRLSDSGMLPEDDRDWARFTVRAPMTGVILEKNVVVGDIVDHSTDLFKIGQLSPLAVWAHVYEEDLPLIESLPRPVEWTIRVPSRPGVAFSGSLEKIGAVIDPLQHTALVTGSVDNRDGFLKVGQFVNVTVQLPPSQMEIELATSAVVEDGRESVVFVQPDKNEFRFERRRVKVVRRFRESIYLDSHDSDLKLGEHVVVSGALMLQNVIDQLPAPKIATAVDPSIAPTSSPSTPIPPVGRTKPHAEVESIAG